MGIFRNSQGKLLYDEPKPVAMFVTLMGAATDIDDNGKIVDYVPRGEVVINVGRIDAYYNHTILAGGHKIRVMETLEEIRRKIRGEVNLDA